MLTSEGGKVAEIQGDVTKQSGPGRKHVGTSKRGSEGVLSKHLGKCEGPRFAGEGPEMGSAERGEPERRFALPLHW